MKIFPLGGASDAGTLPCPSCNGRRGDSSPRWPAIAGRPCPLIVAPSAIRTFFLFDHGTRCLARKTSRAQISRFQVIIAEQSQCARSRDRRIPATHSQFVYLRTHGRGWGSGCCRGSGWRGGGEPLSQLGAHKLPSLYSPRIPAVGCTADGRRYPSPTGGITRSPINASASAKVCWMQLPSAPLAMFSFAAISCLARMSKPFPRTGSRRIASN